MMINYLSFLQGNGEFDEIFSEGYLVAKDSKVDDEVKDSYISHSNLRTIINHIPSNIFLLRWMFVLGELLIPM